MGGSSFHPGIPENAVVRSTVSLLLEQGAPAVSLEIEGRIRRMILDTGLKVSVFQPEVSRSDIEDSPLRPFGANGEVLDVKGQQLVSFKLRKEEFDHTFSVYSHPTDAAGLLGMDAKDRCRNYKKGRLALSVKDVIPPVYELARTKHAVLTLFSGEKSSRISHPKRRAKPNSGARQNDQINRERNAKCARRNAPADSRSAAASGHRVSTQLRLTNMSYHTISYHNTGNN